MKIITYPTTALEDWVTLFMQRLQITVPEQIDENDIARKLHIFLHRKEQDPFYQVIGRYRGITVDIRERTEIQREQFFHELCHVLRHYGVQSILPKSFVDLQEWDARNFTRYTMIPYHMLKFIDFEQNNVVTEMAEMFRVTPELAEERFSQIQRRLNERSFQNERLFS